MNIPPTDTTMRFAESREARSRITALQRAKQCCHADEHTFAVRAATDQRSRGMPEASG